MDGNVVSNTCYQPPNNVAAHRGKVNGVEQGGAGVTLRCVCPVTALANRTTDAARTDIGTSGRPEPYMGGVRRRSTVDSDDNQLLAE